MLEPEPLTTQDMVLASVNLVSIVLTLTPFAEKVLGKLLLIPSGDNCVGVILHPACTIVNVKLERTFHPPLGEGIVVTAPVAIPSDLMHCAAWFNTGIKPSTANKKNLCQILYIIIKTLLLLTLHSFLSYTRHPTFQLQVGKPAGL